MGKPAARITDMHVCPMVTGMVPHVGGPVTGPGVPTVLIGNMPAAVMGDMCVCTGPPDTIILGSMGVFIGGKPAARMGDMCAHGGTIVAGCPNVLIGEALPGSPPSPVLPLPVKAAMQQMTPATAAVADQILTMKAAAKNGTPFCEKCAKAAAGKNKGDQNQQVLSALKPKDSNQPDYPTNSNPGIPDKRTRYNERLGLINNAKNTEPISPDAARAIQRLELNNEAVERAKLADHVYTLNNNTVPEGWIMVPHDKLPQDITWADEKSGFQAEIYQSTFTTPPKVVVSFRGTANKEGWFANLKQALGFKSKQHQQAIELAQRLKDQGINAEFTGHSLGGGLTSAAALVTNSKGYSYNAAGLHPRTVEAAGISDDDIEQQSSMIKAFSSTRDPLTLGQENRGLIKASLVTAASQIPIFGPSLGIGLGLLLFGDPDTVPKAVGEQHKLTPPIPDELKKKSNLLDRVLEGHGMKSMIAGIEEQKTEDLKSLEKSLVT